MEVRQTENAESPVFAKILESHRGSMTDTERRLGQWLLKDPDTFALESAQTIAEMTQCSEATLVRFARKLGYDGYKDFRDSLQRELLQRYSSSVSLAKEPYPKSFENLSITQRINPESALEKAASILVAADCIFLLGSGGSHALLELFSYQLTLHSKKTRILERGLNTAEDELRLSGKDCLFLVSFPPVSQRQRSTVDLALARQLPLVSLTQGAENPHCDHSNACLFASTQNSLANNSWLGPLWVMEELLRKIVNKSALALCILLACLLTAARSEAAVPSSPGFLLPVGGGASTVESSQAGAKSVLKTSQVAIAKAALQQWNQHNLGSARVCLVEYHEENEDLKLTLEVMERLWRAAGAKSILQKILNSKESSRDLGGTLSRDCDIAVLPGGNQTQMRDLWESTPVFAELAKVFLAGGGIVGKSAGAALQGGICYLPEDNAPSGVLDILQGRAPVRRELEHCPLQSEIQKRSSDLDSLPLIYVETHAGDRDRAARSLGMLAHWKVLHPNDRPIGIVLDSDTGALLTKAKGVWTAKVYGARAAEFQSPSSRSEWGLSSDGHPFAAKFISDVLLPGEVFEFDRPTESPGQTSLCGGSVCQISPGRMLSLAPQLSFDSETPVDATLRVRGDEPLFDSPFNGVRAFVKSSGIETSIDSAEYAYLTGQVSWEKTSRSRWAFFTGAFDFDTPQPENRLNIQRYLLSLKAVHRSVSLSKFTAWEMTWTGETTCASLATDPRDASSCFVYDVRFARNRKPSSYIYSEMGVQTPVQTGGWREGTVELLAPKLQSTRQ